ncbi:hypothetical protein [Sphingobium yanoikuyae]|uniref:hypothetical protein n=1 Tax=Sphingobium yanoikuyae TaxID=13690 RepID=UPI0028AB6F7A|nr:hypothetical protein [Sphingobium yanoikuyae]
MCAPASPSAELLALITAYRAKADACTAHTCNVYSPTHSAWQAEVEAIPHLTTKTGYQYLGEVHQLSTDRPGHVAAAKSAAKLAPGGLWSAEYEACCAELRDLVAQREAQRVALDLKYQVNALGNENDRLGDVAYDVLCEIEDFPSRTIADLLTKLDLIDETAGQLDIDMVRRDLRRIAGEA